MIDFWTIERTDKLRTLKAKGYSCAEIAARLGGSRNAIIGKIQRLDLAKPRTPLLSPEEKAARLANRRRIDAEAKRMRGKNLQPTGRVYLAGNGQVRPVLQIVKQEAIREIDIAPLNMAFADLQPGDCRYPFGDGPFTFCGRPALVCGPYCKAHADLCSNKSVQYRVAPQKQSARTMASGWV